MHAHVKYWQHVLVEKLPKIYLTKEKSALHVGAL